MVSREFGELSYSRLLQEDEYLGPLDPTLLPDLPQPLDVCDNSVYLGLSGCPAEQCMPQVGPCPGMSGQCPGLSAQCPEPQGPCPDLSLGCPDLAAQCSDMAGQCPELTGPVAVAGPSGASPYSMDTQLTELPSRKRKSSFQTGSEDYEDDTGDDKSVRTTDDNKKQNHSEIEKRRRDKMNTYIQELSAMVPMCHAMSRKLDKLTVLRLAVQHLRSVRGAVHSYTEGRYKPSFLSDTELKALILQRADGFLFAVGCDRGRLLYVSDSVEQILNYSPGDLLGQSWFDILHPKDVAKVKEQLSSSDLNPRERLIDAKTMLPVKTDLPAGTSKLCPGARRSFFCRMKCRSAHPTSLKEESDSMSTISSTSCPRKRKQTGSDKRYLVIQCSGYLKSWAGDGGAGGAGSASEGGAEGEAECSGGGSLSCLVAVGRPRPEPPAPPNHPPPPCRPLHFISRHAMDGKFLYVDQRSTLVMGFLPQELLGTSMYEYFHREDIPGLAEAHKLALLGATRVLTPPYRARTKDGSFARLQSEWKAFRNPWTKEVDYLVAKNSVVLSEDVPFNTGQLLQNNTPTTFDFLGQSSGSDMYKYISSHVESSKIGSQIAHQVLSTQRRGDSSSSESSPDPGQQSEQDSELSSSLPQPPLAPPNGLAPSMEGPPTDGSDEAAMAVIMSLLEADAGLGGPVDFTGLPWPLP